MPSRSDEVSDLFTPLEDPGAQVEYPSAAAMNCFSVAFVVISLSSVVLNAPGQNFETRARRVGRQEQIMEVLVSATDQIMAWGQL